LDGFAWMTVGYRSCGAFPTDIWSITSKETKIETLSSTIGKFDVIGFPSNQTTDDQKTGRRKSETIR
jgi:hypothetical protein